MKTFFRLSLLILLVTSFLTLAAYAQDYYVFGAGDLKDVVSFSTNMSMLNDTLFENGSAYVSTGPLEDDYASTNNTAIILDFNNIASQMKIKDYPVVKIGYKSMTEVEDTQITLNVHADTAEESAYQFYCATLDYEKTGQNTYLLFNLATTATGIKNNGWSKITADSPLYKLRIKPYISKKTMNKGDYFDIEYIGFFKTEDEAKAHAYTLDKSLDDILFNEQVIRIVKNGTKTLSYSFAPVYADVQTVSFISDNTQIATIDNNGKITGVSAGVTIVRATAGEHSTTCKVYVLEEEIPAVEIISKDIIHDTDEIVVNSLGDSITKYSPNPYYSYNYHVWWAKWYYISNNNYGISGTTITPRVKQDDPSFLERYDTMTDDADLITVKGGTNDWGVSIPLGSSTTRSSNTFMGSLRLLVEGLIDKYPSKPIVLFTPIKRCGDGKTPDTVNGNGDKLIDFANAVIEIGEIYGIPVIDLYTPEVLDFTDLGPYEDYETMMPDHLHPSGAGQKIMGEYMMQKMIEIGVVKDVTNEIGNLDIDFDNIEFYKYTADELLSTAVGTQCQVNSELIDNYMRITTSSTSTDTNTYVTLDLEALGADFPVKQFKYAVVSYRSEMESNQPWNMSVLIKRDGIYSRHWGMNHYPLRDGKQQYDILPIHTLISGGEKAGYTSYDDIDDDSILKQIRLKPWGGGELIPGEGDYLDIEFIAFFDEAYLANAYLLNEINGDSADGPDDNPDDDPENDPTDVPGDVNGDGKVTRPDLIRLTQYFANWDVEINNYSADTNGDGKVTRPDLIRLTQYFANWDVELGK